MKETISLDWLVEQVLQVLEEQKKGRQSGVPTDPIIRPELYVKDSEHAEENADLAVDRAVEEAGEPTRAGSNIPDPKWREGMEELLMSTPARIGVWRVGTRPLTSTMLALRNAHAAAVDAVFSEVSASLLEHMQLFTVETYYDNAETFLRRPDKGRRLTDEGVAKLKTSCVLHPQVQIVIADGLSADAIESNLANVLPALYNSLKVYGLTSGTPFFVKGGRVGCMDHIGEIIDPEVLVLLIGERPGLVSSESMSAYMCYRPHGGTVESDRTVISNIHRGGTSPIEAGAHIGTVLSKMIEQRTSGVKLVM